MCATPGHSRHVVVPRGRILTEQHNLSVDPNCLARGTREEDSNSDCPVCNGKDKECLICAPADDGDEATHQNDESYNF